MNLLNAKVALWIIALMSVVFMVKIVFFPENRYQIVPADPDYIVGRIDTKTGEITFYAFNPDEEKFTTVEEVFKGSKEVPNKKWNLEGLSKKK